MNYRQTEETVFKAICYCAAIASASILIFILGRITIEGLPYINWQFLSISEANFPGFGGAIGNAIAGTVLLSVMATLFASPLAVGMAVYMKRYASNSFIIKAIDFSIEVLAGTPSIILGALGLLILVIYLNYYTGGFSLIAGAIGLAVLILPVIERAAEQAISTVPKELEEASYALGADRWKTITGITLPYALSGIITGIVLGVGRAAEESAIVILTAGYSQFMPEFKIVSNDALFLGIKIYPLQSLVGSLPLNVYNCYHYPMQITQGEGFAAALVLIILVMFINIATRLLLRRRRIG